ncbi:MAG: glycoside hydrolase family 13 protein [Anaerolineales bacterium]
MSTPSWIHSSVFYQIFPDRFANGNRDLNPPNVQPWGSPPTLRGFQGGDLAGIMQRFDYLLDLGVNALYLNPIFLSPSNHRYNTTDYYQVDPKLGSLEDFRSFLDLAHRHGVRVLLDGVFNHCGRGFFAFVDLLENEEDSPYRDWFHVNGFPVEAYGSGEATTYEAWWRFKSLPKFNIANPRVRSYLLGVARHWMQQGIDGWRLDVPNEIPDRSFWSEFRDVVKSANPDAYLLGEIWTVDPSWVGDHAFDGLLNYPFRAAVMAFLRGELEAGGFAKQLEAILSAYPRENGWAHYLPLGSHDTPRLRTVLGDAALLRSAYLLQFFFPGAPAIYYGDEIGLKGGTDPECRGPFPWDPKAWDTELREHVAKLVQLRRSVPVLQEGDFLVLWTSDEDKSLAFGRRSEAGAAALVLNNSASAVQVRVPVSPLGWGKGFRLREALGGREVAPPGDQLVLQLPARSGQILLPA